ncbi:hypothetical protein RB619_01300 [Flavobacterium sp. LHD-80]|uniref:hypothetical protein n=1 Tax=Flavobacterium sp. LHD-80 TaxID=3071411 RepID=UPI0027E07686|nr:hypothetical protein [Flavobacterium sp. LHD-80]MDQ6469259.1 hypothetical protein [Flavobacterium sp. LHD-80]
MEKEIIIENVGVWMDGGTVTLKMKKDNSIFYEIDFVQKVILEKSKRQIENSLVPGSLLLNRKEVEIRSSLEKEILSEIKAAKFGTNISQSEIDALNRIILEAINFVESEDYITVARKVGRIK